MTKIAAGCAAKLGVLLEMIKFRLTVFALPFAFIGALLAARGIPQLSTILLILLAMTGARTCAMTFNRIVDCRFDAANPRTADRALPAGRVTPAEAWLLVTVSAVLFFVACLLLNPLTLQLSPFVLGLTLFYSFCKRFTSFCHGILGVALACSPLGGWVAVTGSLTGFPWVLSFGVAFWVAGFDVMYACLDTDFDRSAGLCSLPARLGRQRAFRLAALFHLAAVICFAAVGVVCDLNIFYRLGVAVAAGALFFQHWRVRPDNLADLQASFFAMNGFISVVLFVAALFALLFS